MKSQSFGRLIAGPVGSGKTTACMFELFRRAAEQAPAPLGAPGAGLRYTRFAIVRQTLLQLKDTVLKDIMAWLPQVASFKVSASTVEIEAGDVRSEWHLIPLDDPEDQRRLLSLQLTGAWMNEAIEMDCGLVSPLAARCGRYPSAAQGGASWFGMVADTNMPSEGSDWHEFMALDTPADWQIFVQPGGMAPEAENLEWLVQTPATLKLPPTDERRRAQGRTYYERFIRSNSLDWCKRYVHAQYGPDPTGTAVFRESFKRAFHVVGSPGGEGLEPVGGHTLIVGQDFGRDPWSIICQMDHKGRLLVLGEVAAEDIGLQQHVTQHLRPTLQDVRYLGRPTAIVGDPAGRQKSSLYEETSFDLLKRMGFMAFPAPTNDIAGRLRAVEAFLLGQIDGGPMIIIDGSRCPTLVRALAEGYRFGKTKAGDRKPLPEKNEYSHPADALQYACLAAQGGAGSLVQGYIIHRLKRRGSAREGMPASAWT